MIIRKETTQKDTIRLEFIGRDLTEHEKEFMNFVCSWMQGVLSTKDEGFVMFSIKQLGKSLEACSDYLKKWYGI